MPILFKSIIQESGLHGKGIFAAEDIPAGAVWWVCDEIGGIPTENCENLPNIIWDKEAFEAFASSTPHVEVTDVLTRTMNYEDGNVFIYLRDGTQVMNHSDEPNSQVVYNEEGDYRQLRSIAIRDIKAGEELTENYAHYTKSRNNWVEEVFREYLPSRLEFERDFKIRSTKEIPL
jgi:hypothetical protein